MDESIAESYYNLLERSNNKIAVLVNFLSDSCGASVEHSFIGRLVKLYGAEIVFYAILSLATSEISAIDSFQNYLSAVCKKIFYERHTKNQETDLTNLARQLYRRLQNANKRTK